MPDYTGLKNIFCGGLRELPIDPIRQFGETRASKHFVRGLRMRKLLIASMLGFLSFGACKTTEFKTNGGQRAIGTETETFFQDEYPTKALNLVTGDERLAAIEQFNQSPIPLDILIVIDNSGSMAEEQQGLADKIEPLLSEVNDSNWRVNIINTDAGDPQCSRALIVKGDPQAAEKFKAGINAGTDGAGLERGVLRSVQGLECNNNWLRTESVVAVLVVSDEDNCSIANGNYGCEDDPKELNGEMLLEKLSSIRTVGETARVYGILFGPDDDIAECVGNNNVTATIYDDVIQKTNGVRGKICSNDYTQTLQTISRDLASLLKNQFSLAAQPHDGSARVYLDGERYENFTVEDNKVVLADRLAQGQTVTIDYLYGEVSGLQTVAIDSQPNPGSIQVIIDGEVVDPSRFTFDDQQGYKIKLADPLVGVHDITVSYKEEIPLKKQFALTRRNFTGVEVTVNGQNVTFTADPLNGSVSLDETPAPGSEIVVSYDYIK
ncbi:hypothetical protein SAMN06296036_115119 [Pseudobacteriovorax antillogorgiicola]|uniref:von Willebrand factor type A domain-containing protein n=2 Tax=Pseudobacteriovorax antillogorgiicola TaxID=1513793 RepID=A0A1Y6CA00_9BACT|nr:hypothetical protein EDD56_110150 [Pseudobacteriovorax antillogorgiicola]SMF49814.1 hypothetical protein SAMN06296036_115119 [Pseudobacteriovorax antillogorgiicola]